MTVNGRSILILGTRGIPAAHGGFETFAERLALFLQARGWKVGVYCQQEVRKVSRRLRSTSWNGIELIHVEVAAGGPAATLLFDWHCTLDAARRGGVCLVLGYNGAAFLPLLKLAGRRIVTNMDGLEWKRPKWGAAARSWFWVNEWIAAWVSDTLVADHPAIAAHLKRRSKRRQAMIPYGADLVRDAPEAPVRALGLEPGNYLVSIARIEPDNNILPMVEAFSRRRRDARFAVLGRLSDALPYHRAVRAAAGGEVLFPGAIYDPDTVAALRFHARAHMHGHTVGGTNPSLVEALAAGNAVIAHDNPFNRWTAGPAGRYFRDAGDCEAAIDAVLSPGFDVAAARGAAWREASSRFVWNAILEAYETEFERHLVGAQAGAGVAAVGATQRS